MQNKERKCRHKGSGNVGRKIFWSSLSKNILNLEIFNAWTSRDETVRIGFMLICNIFRKFDSFPIFIRGGDLTLNYSRVIVLNLNLIDWCRLGEDTSANLREVRDDWHHVMFIFILLVGVITGAKLCDLTPGTNNPIRAGPELFNYGVWSEGWDGRYWISCHHVATPSPSQHQQHSQIPTTA